MILIIFTKFYKIFPSFSNLGSAKILRFLDVFEPIERGQWNEMGQSPKLKLTNTKIKPLTSRQNL